MKVTITEPCRIDGMHKDAGSVVDLNDNDAMAIVSAGRGTIDKDKSAAAQAEAAKKAKKAE